MEQQVEVELRTVKQETTPCAPDGLFFLTTCLMTSALFTSSSPFLARTRFVLSRRFLSPSINTSLSDSSRGGERLGGVFNNVYSTRNPAFAGERPASADLQIITGVSFNENTQSSTLKH